MSDDFDSVVARFHDENPGMYVTLMQHGLIYYRPREPMEVDGIHYSPRVVSPYPMFSIREQHSNSSGMLITAASYPDDIE